MTIFESMNYFLILVISFCLVGTTTAQTPFLENQKSYPRVVNAIKTKNDSLKKQFEARHLQWPPKQLYLRSFKYDSQLEVWARNSKTEAFTLFKVYKICALSGTIGPKRLDGDYQVPEGFYYINEFNPKSAYHLSLGINYPNASDHYLSDSLKPGNAIFIHGSCVTQGCIPLQDDQIEELYLLASYARSQGQDFIPVHIFPIRFNNEKSKTFFQRSSKDDMEYQRFANELKDVFDYFEHFKKLPVISINNKGDYEIY